MGALDSKLSKQDIKRILKDHKDILDKYKVRIIGLFGSYVREEQREYSDIDLLVEFNENSYDNFINLIFELEGLFGKEVTVVSENDLSPYLLPYVLKEVEQIEG